MRHSPFQLTMRYPDTHCFVTNVVAVVFGCQNHQGEVGWVRGSGMVGVIDTPERILTDYEVLAVISNINSLCTFSYPYQYPR